MTRPLLYTLLLALGCAPGTEALPPTEAHAPAKPLPQKPVLDLLTTAHATIMPAHPRMDPADTRSPSIPRLRYAMEDEGFGESVSGKGVAYVQRVSTGEGPPAPGPHPKRLVRFVHLSDLQLADDESPGRAAQLDDLGETNGAFRPQEGHGCRIVRAAVETINALDQADPLAFVLLGGDNADNAQDNETDWILKLLAPSPTPLECDSGDDDDLPGEDVKDPFVSSGLRAPFKWISGNHDLLMQGNVAIDGAFKALALGVNPRFGTRDYRIAGAPVVLDPVPADPRRAMHSRVELLQQVLADGDGHGLTPEIAASGKAIYSFDAAGSDLRFIALDTTAETGGSEGLIRRGDLQTRILPELDRARAEKKRIVLTAHHGIEQLTIDGGTLGFVQDDAVPVGEWLAVLDRYPEILFNLVGHSHEHRVREIALPSGRRLFEVMTASLMDFPGQFRLIELSDEDNGWYKLRATCVDYLTKNDALAEEGRALMYLDYVSGWGIDGASHPGEGNVELYVRSPR